MVDATGISRFNEDPEEFELLTGVGRDASLYLKFKGRRNGVELKFTPDEIKAIREWLGRLTQ